MALVPWIKILILIILAVQLVYYQMALAIQYQLVYLKFCLLISNLFRRAMVLRSIKIIRWRRLPELTGEIEERIHPMTDKTRVDQLIEHRICLLDVRWVSDRIRQRSVGSVRSVRSDVARFRFILVIFRFVAHYFLAASSGLRSRKKQNFKFSRSLNDWLRLGQLR